MSTPTPHTTPLDAAIASVHAAVAAHTQAVTNAKQAEADTKAAAERAALEADLAQLREQGTPLLAPELWEALEAAVVTWTADAHQSLGTDAAIRLLVDGEVWYLHQRLARVRGHGNQPEDYARRFNIRDPRGNQRPRAVPQSYQEYVHIDTLRPDQVQHWLLYGINEYRETMRVQRQTDAAYEQQCAEDYAAREAEAARAAVEQEEGRAIVEAAKAEAEAALWQWPAGVELTLYRVRYTIATARTDDYGEATGAEYAEAYSLSDGPDAGGWWTFLPAGDAEDGPAPVAPAPDRRTKLTPWHLPVVEALTVAGLEDLPGELRASRTVVIAGWTAYGAFWDEERATYRRLEHGSITQDVGQEPIGAIKMAVDVAQAAQAARSIGL